MKIESTKTLISLRKKKKFSRVREQKTLAKKMKGIEFPQTNVKLNNDMQALKLLREI